MSYAVIQTGGKQYKVKSGQILKIEKLPGLDPKSMPMGRNALSHFIGQRALMKISADWKVV